MTKFYEDEDVVFDVTFYDAKARISPVDPSSIVLEIEAPSGILYTPTVYEDGARPQNVGKYTSSYTVDEWGEYHWRWKTEGPRLVKQGKFDVIKNITGDE